MRSDSKGLNHRSRCFVEHPPTGALKKSHAGASIPEEVIDNAPSYATSKI